MESALARRAAVLCGHLAPGGNEERAGTSLFSQACLEYCSPEKNEGNPVFNASELQELIDEGSSRIHEGFYQLLRNNQIFWYSSNPPPGHLYTFSNYNTTKEEQRDLTFRRIMVLRDRGLLRGWLTEDSIECAREKFALHEAISVFDHSMAVKMGVHFHLWGGAVKYLGTERHRHFLKKTEDYVVAGSFSLTELGHGSNVRGIETLATYDPYTEEFVLKTPCETAQKYWIGGVAMHANHTVAFAQLCINGRNEGVHAFIVPIRDSNGQTLPNIRIADCGHKIGLNGIDNGRLWFDCVRVPREYLLNAVADVTAEGKYLTSIKDPDQRFAALMAPLTSGRVTIAFNAVTQCKIGLSTALRYAMSRRAFSPAPGLPEVLLIDYPTHQRRLLPLLAKTYAAAFASNHLKNLYLSRQKSDAKMIHVLSSGLKAINSWHMLRTLQECREACGGMGLKSDNRIAQLRSEHDVLTTFEGDNVVLMQTVSKAILGDFLSKKSQQVASMSKPSMFGSATSLEDPLYHMHLFQSRERTLLQKMAARFYQLKKQGLSTADALNECHALGSDLGVAHTELQILRSFSEAIKRSSSTKEILGKLCSLFVLTSLDEDPVWTRHGIILQPEAEAIQDAVSRLCCEVRPHTLGLLQAFNIPMHLLGPIAGDWVDYESWKNAHLDLSLPTEMLSVE